MSQTQQPQPSFFPTAALDHAFAGLGAGVVAVLCMHPLDLLKVKFQVATEKPQGGVGRAIWSSLKGIHASDGWKGLYRGVGANVAGNASSWGLYFLFPHVHNEARRPNSVPQSMALDGFSNIWRNEGLAGLYRGTSLALVGVGNGAIQFMAYEEMKQWGFDRKKRQFAKAGKEYTTADDKLNNLTSHLYPTIPVCIKKTWVEEGVRGFYRGLGTNLVRVLPGTCVTFVVYENLAWLLRSTAIRRDRRTELAVGEGS
uniref:Oligopeptidase B n=1 Tax=Ganoderma boninense TaxID=34458 RepID=A0A5K1K1D5_9APHY|nr:Oligopeptidase B [Ganoderma boninense]